MKEAFVNCVLDTVPLPDLIAPLLSLSLTSYTTNLVRFSLSLPCLCPKFGGANHHTYFSIKILPKTVYPFHLDTLDFNIN